MSETNNKDTILTTLKEGIIRLVNETDNQILLAQCLDMLQNDNEKAEGDEIVDVMAVTGQLKDVGYNKQEMISQALESYQEDQEEEEIITENANASLIQRFRKWKTPVTIVIAALLLFLLLIVLPKHISFNNHNKYEGLKTVAEDFETIEVNGYRFNMVHIKGGTFTMGATKEQSGEEDSDELPVHQVTVSNFSIGETEVTQGLWEAVMGARPTIYDGEHHPMKELSWDDCQEFIVKINKMTGRHFSLPTEAQWEFAARGGNKSKHYKYSGSNNLDEVGWFCENTWNMGKDSPDFGNHPVGSKKPNELGIYDMSGNVWEWCQDAYSKYTTTPQKDPKGPTDNKSYRVNRGGSWDYVASSSRVANRRNRTPDFRNFNIGMRLAE